MKTSRPRRRRRGAKRMDLTAARALLKDQRHWAAIGVVTAPADGSPYWRVDTDESGAGVDVLVEVVLHPEGVPVTARLAAGVWLVPSLGEEVAVLIPSGQIDFMPIIVGILSSNFVPPSSSGQGPDPSRIVIARSQVMIHDGNGGANPLPTLAELTDTVNKLTTLIQKYIVHTHTGVTTGTGVSGPPSDIALVSPEPPVGTQVFQTK